MTAIGEISLVLSSVFELIMCEIASAFVFFFSLLGDFL
jgi:hypothetical protein